MNGAIEISNYNIVIRKVDMNKENNFNIGKAFDVCGGGGTRGQMPLNQESIRIYG